MILKKLSAVAVVVTMVFSSIAGITVKAETSCAAMVGDVEYESLAQAVAAAQEAYIGEPVVVTLMANANESFTLDSGIVKLETNSYSYTGTATVYGGILIADNKLKNVVCGVEGVNSENTAFGYTSLAPGVEIVDGAQVRIGEGADEDGRITGDGSGLRFIATVDRNETLASLAYEFYDAENSNYPEGYQMGIKIKAEGSDDAVTIPATRWQEEGSVFTVALTNLAESNYNRKFTANAYVEVEGIRFEDATESTRSIYQVAAGLLAGSAVSQKLVDVLNAYVNQTGVRLTLSNGGVTDVLDIATGSAKGAYSGEAFFTIGDTTYRNGVYTVTLTAIGKSVINTALFNEYVRINNNNSKVNPVTKIKDNGDGTYTITFDYAGIGTGVITEPISLESGDITVQIPAGVEFTGSATELKLVLKNIADEDSEVEAGEDEELESFDIHVAGVAESNTTPVIITIPEAAEKGLNLGNLVLYHVEDGVQVKMEQVDSVDMLTKHNQFTYDPLDGTIAVALASFSEVAVISNTENGWNGERDYTWYDANATELTISNADQLAAFGAIVGGMDGQARDNFKGKTVTLTSDINLGDKDNANENLIFHPIGYYYTDDDNADGTAGDYYSTVKSFEGTFDGNGHTISNFYQNTWEIKGDYEGNYYCDAMGLFGYVVDGTVKNLTVDNFSSDGEYTPTGVIAAYAVNSTFENIAITNCNPRVYNTGNGGIVGIGGSSEDTEDSKLTFTNITIDNTNKISALWGSWDVACGGLVGMFRGDGCVGMTNCHVAAQMDVYNDVCGNYQYYWYRYSGMMVGTNKNMTTDVNGYTVPETDKFYAKNCTVHFGEWNDYYYCELVANSIASYTHDYQFSRLTQIESLDEIKSGETWTKEGNFLLISSNTKTCYHIVNKDGVLTPHNHADAGEETVDGETVLKEDKTIVYLPFNQLFTGYGWGVKHIPVYNGEDYAFEGITILDREVADSKVKFETRFTGDFLYRVGNQNTVSLGSLFEAVKDAEINKSGVYVTIDKVDEETNVSGTYTANTTDWTKGTIQFSGTGVVKVTIQDYDYCIPTVLYLEVVEATNVTAATSATANNVVLLNDISGTFTVSNGYTFYGNGFTVTLPTTSVQETGNGFTGYISIGATQDDGVANGGHLDNVRIEGPVYPEMYIYRDQAKITDSSDADYGSGSNMRYFKNSVIVYGGNVTISNCYISGSRTALCLRGGNNVVIENTTLSGGAYANMQICAGSQVTLRDVTTVQTDVEDSYGKGKTAHGLGIAVDSNVVDLYIEGDLNQYNWLCEEQWNSIVPSDYQSVFPKFFTNSTFSSYWHYLNGSTAPYVNMAFIYACNWDTSKIHDNRETVDYGTCDATIAGVAGGVYSKVNTVGGNAITDSDLADPGYTSTGFNPVAPKFEFDNAANYDADDESDASDTYCVYDESSGTLKIGITDDSKTIDLSGVSISKNGTDLNYTAYLNGTEIEGNSVTIKSADGAKQTLVFKATSNDAGYDADGQPIEGSIEYTWTVTVEVATLAYPAPVWNMSDDYQFDTSSCVYAYYSTSQGYGEAVPIYEGIKVNYYNKSGTLVELDLSGTTTLPTGSENSNSNAFTYTLADGSTLTMKFSSGWKSGATTHQFTAYNDKVYIYPQSLDNDNYVREKTTNQDFNVKITYTFTDPNGQSTDTVTMNWYNAAASNGSVNTVQWKTFDSTNGKKFCVTPDTLVTMADGSKKEIQYVSVGEEVVVWNFYTGEYEIQPVSLLQAHGTGVQSVLHLRFEDGTELKVLGEHGIFDADLNTFVFIDENDVDSYVGHCFVKKDGGSYKLVKLVDYEVTEEYTTAYTILSYDHYNVMLEDMFTVTPAHVGDNFFNPFEINEGMKYDEASMQADVEKYGLYTYEDFEHVLTYEQFEALNMGHFKVSVGKGLVTYEGLIYLIKEFINR